MTAYLPKPVFSLLKHDFTAAFTPLVISPILMVYPTGPLMSPRSVSNYLVAVFTWVSYKHLTLLNSCISKTELLFLHTFFVVVAWLN